MNSIVYLSLGKLTKPKVKISVVVTKIVDPQLIKEMSFCVATDQGVNKLFVENVLWVKVFRK